MEDKKPVDGYYTIESGSLQFGILGQCYWEWEEIYRKDNLKEVEAEYKKLLPEHDALRLVQTTFTTIEQSFKTPRFIGELEQSLNEVEEHIRKSIIEFLKGIDLNNYSCNIRLAGGYVVTELVLDYDRELIEVVFTGPSGSSDSSELSDFSAKEQLSILKAITKNQ